MTAKARNSSNFTAPREKGAKFYGFATRLAQGHWLAPDRRPVALLAAAIVLAASSVFAVPSPGAAIDICSDPSLPTDQAAERLHQIGWIEVAPNAVSQGSTLMQAAAMTALDIMPHDSVFWDSYTAVDQKTFETNLEKIRSRLAKDSSATDAQVKFFEAPGAFFEIQGLKTTSGMPSRDCNLVMETGDLTDLPKFTVIPGSIGGSKHAIKFLGSFNEKKDGITAVGQLAVSVIKDIEPHIGQKIAPDNVPYLIYVDKESWREGATP